MQHVAGEYCYVSLAPMKFIHILTYIKYTANHNLETVHSHAVKKQICRWTF